MKTFNVDEILQRMRLVFGVTTNKDLSGHIQMSQQALSGWISRNVIPLEILLKCAVEKNVSIDWLIFGKESTALATDEKMMLLAFNDLDERGKLQAISLVSGLKGTQQSLCQSVQGDGNTLAGRDVNIKSTD